MKYVYFIANILMVLAIVLIIKLDSPQEPQA